MLDRRKFIKLCVKSLILAPLVELAFHMPTGRSSRDIYIPVLLYHRVGYTKDPLTVTPERFAEDLEILKDSGYQTISLDLFEQFVSGDHSIDLPEKPILITFDDGYLDNYQNAYPILQRFNMTATFFIITGLLWTENRMRAEHIIEMSKGGMSFGSHTVSHHQLATLTPGQITEELADSHATLERIVQKPIRALSYPKGSYNQTVIDIAKDQGYTLGFTVHNGICRKKSSVFELRRIPVFRYDGNILSVIAKRKTGDNV